ncbi:ABC transporter ATP-binding protein [Kocuria tytonis]|uniref:ATP-binding cassette domain-containing protein n=1 Tax=Kocuria tytonis TaxID=2054280 RepID=A0A495A790_9MICC|nr:ATP-binding cassette domain-containing protein [Kocuria tytonis]RKQ35126.1 ATP-binding cassette domain-containing protein [Kocuria tytonis]
MIEAENLEVEKGGSLVLSVASFTAEVGAVTGLIGPSGCGKSTMLNCLGLLERVDRGTLRIDGMDLTRPSNAQRGKFWKDRAAFVFQDYGIIEDWTAQENILLRKTGRFSRTRGKSSVYEALDFVGLTGRGNETASYLSGGEKQRLSIARTLHKKASYIFADEPTASLDTENRRRVIDLLTACAASGATVIVATHDEDMMRACDTTYDLRQ